VHMCPVHCDVPSAEPQLDRHRLYRFRLHGGDFAADVDCLNAFLFTEQRFRILVNAPARLPKDEFMCAGEQQSKYATDLLFVFRRVLCRTVLFWACGMLLWF
jgi:hypothetical protein